MLEGLANAYRVEVVESGWHITLQAERCVDVEVEPALICQHQSLACAKRLIIVKTATARRRRSKLLDIPCTPFHVFVDSGCAIDARPCP